MAENDNQRPGGLKPNLDTPITLLGAAALSIETNTSLYTPAATAASTTCRVPPMLFVTASAALSSNRVVFVRRGMKHDGRLLGDEDVTHPLTVTHITDHG